MIGRDRDRLKVLHKAERGHLTQPQAGGQLGLNERAAHPKGPTCSASPRSSARRNLKRRALLSSTVGAGASRTHGTLASLSASSREATTRAYRASSCCATSNRTRPNSRER